MTDRIVKIVLRGDVSGLVSSLKVATSSIKATAASMTDSSKESKKWREDLTAVGTSAGKLGLVAAAGVGLAIRSFANFDEAISHVAATGKDAADSIGGLRQAALDAGQRTAYSATEAAGAIEELAKAGVSAKDILAGGLNAALDLAAAGGLSVSEAATIAATTLNQFSLSGNKAEHVADLLASAANSAQGSVSDVGEALKYVGPVAAQMGVSLEETTGVIAELASQGILAGNSGTALRGVLSALTSPSQIASKTMSELGVNVYDAQGQFVGFKGVAEQLHQTLGGLTNSERDQALGRIFGNEQITAARILYAGGAADVEKWTKAVSQDGAAADQARQRLDNLKGDLEQLKGAFETALIGSGSGANGPFREITQELTDLINAYNKLPGPIKSGALAAAGLTAAVGGTLFVASRAISGYASMSKSLGGLGIDFENVNKRALLFQRGGALAAAAGLAALSGPAHHADESLGELTDAAAAAAAGFAAGGPWGAAIGGGIALLSSLGKSGKASAQDLASLTATLDEQTGAVTDNTASWVAKKLADTDASKFIEAAGVTLATQTDAVLGNKDAMERVTEASQKYGLIGSQILDPITSLRDGIKDGAKANVDATAATEGSIEAQKVLGDTATTAADGVKDLKDALDGLLDPTLNQDEATVAWRRSIQSLTEDLAKNGGSLSLNTKQGQDNRDAIRDRVSALKESVEADLAANGTQEEATAKLKRGVAQILASADAAHLSKAEVRNYLDTLNLTPAQLKTVFDADTGPAIQHLDTLQRKINDIHGKTVVIRATGDARLANGRNALLEAHGGIVDYYADGGLRENHVAQIAAAGSMRVWAEPETGGEAYIPFAESKRKRSQQIAMQTVSRLGGTAYFANGGSTGGGSAARSAPETVSDVLAALGGVRLAVTVGADSRTKAQWWLEGQKMNARVGGPRLDIAGG